jgi:hypothetical protein
MAEFEYKADSEIITIEGFTITPAEAAHLKEAVSFAGGMRDLPRLPPQIDYEQFVVKFSEDGSLVVNRATGEGGEIKFHFNTVDRLVVAITDALGVSVDRKMLRPSPRSVGDPGFLAEGDIIEGSG